MEKIKDFNKNIVLCPVCDGRGYKEDKTSCEFCKGKGEFIIKDKDNKEDNK